jgi:hypothetical protein
VVSYFYDEPVQRCYQEALATGAIVEGDMVFRMKKNGVLALKWLGKGEVDMILTAHMPAIGKNIKCQKSPGVHVEQSIREAILDYR